jgi:hypothetical protein
LTVPVLRVLGGLALVAAGLLSYFGIVFNSPLFLLFIIAGAAVILVALVGHRPRPGDIVIFVVGILVLGSVTAGYKIGVQSATFSATTAQVAADKIDLSVTATTGSVSIFFLNRSELAYQVNISQSFGGFSIPLAPTQSSLTNFTRNGIFTLRINSSFSAVDVFLRHGYFTNISASTNTGSVSLISGVGDRLGTVSLSSSTGSVDVTSDTSTIRSLDLRTQTGSINLESTYFGTTFHRVPVTLATSLGSVNVALHVPSDVAVSVTASTGLGSLSHDLRGFSISEETKSSLVASAGDVNASPYSLIITSSTSLGSQSISIVRTSGVAPSA